MEGFTLSASGTCPNCGRPFTAGQLYCVNCGAHLPAAAAPPPTAPPPTPSGPAPPPAGAPPGYPPPYAPPTYPPYAGYAPPVRADFSTIFSGTFRVWTENFGPLFAVYLVLALLVGGLSVAAAFLFYGIPYVSGGFLGVGGTAPTLADPLAYTGYELAIVIVSWLLGSLILGGVTDFAIRRHRGEAVPIMVSLNRGFSRVLSILGANLLVTVITSGVVLLWTVLITAGAFELIAGGVSAGALALLCGGVIALPFIFVLVIYLSIALSLYAPAIMVEGRHAVDSLGRSWSLTKGHKWSILGAAIIVGILLVLVDGAIVFVGALSGNWVVLLTATAIGGAITGPWITILLAVAYDLVVRSPQPTVWPPTMMPPPPAYPPQ